ncbi:proline-rich protein PRCC [Copidosoma floridanum]|uniref:proline-rich protein PRCC n=1 Tax=Copidosoma floridanum TaxID=29053 RepID=UPI0006C9941B|nr:proline-rich protein PRCC [Copidosoma floridanum]
MSLVAYGSSDESENEDEYNDQPQVETKNPALAAPNEKKSNDVPKSSASKSENVADINREIPTHDKTQTSAIKDGQKSAKLNLPIPKLDQNQDSSSDNTEYSTDEALPDFNVLPKPKMILVDEIKEADSVPVPKKIDYGSIEMPPKKNKGPAKISIPSLSDFKDLEEEDDASKRHTVKASNKQSGLIGILPPPKGSISLTKATSMLPNVLTRKTIESKPLIPQPLNRTTMKKPVSQAKPSTLTSLSSYTSDSEDDDEKGSSSDFFSLSTPAKIPDQLLPMSSIDMIDDTASSSSMSSSLLHNDNTIQQSEDDSRKILRNNVMDISKEEIILKNKAEVGPKLPIPEQEYHVDSEGNVAFDEKAIEYLCGKRGVKRKNELSKIDVVEISGDDIKPDEREWLVKALTEEQTHRPISISSGPGGQSKKKHQITYLAHQAKAMELELKNQWAQNKANRQATRSKYGF